MSGIKILPDELIDIVEDYASEVYLRKIDSIPEITQNSSNKHIIYSPTIIITYFCQILQIYYKKQLKLALYVPTIDTYGIIDDKTVMVEKTKYNLETGEATYSLSQDYLFVNVNEGIFNTYLSTKKWSLCDKEISAHALITANGNIWDISKNKLTYNGEDMIEIGALLRLMCTIKNNTVILFSNHNEIIVYQLGDVRLRKISMKVCRFYGSEYVVGANGDVFKFETLEL